MSYPKNKYIRIKCTSGGTVSITGDGVTMDNSTTKARVGSGEVRLTMEAANGFNIIGSYTVKTESCETVSVSDNKFIMPTEPVIISAAFDGDIVSATLAVTGNNGTICTAFLLDNSYKEVRSLKKNAGEEYIMCVNAEAEYEYSIRFTL